MENTAAAIQPRSLEPGKHLNFLIVDSSDVISHCATGEVLETCSQAASRISYSLFASKQQRREFILKYFCVTSADGYAYVGLHGKNIGKC